MAMKTKPASISATMTSNHKGERIIKKKRAIQQRNVGEAQKEKDEHQKNGKRKTKLEVFLILAKNLLNEGKVALSHTLNKREADLKARLSEGAQHNT